MWLFFLNILNTVSILWHNTHQIIPVGDDLTPYKNKPYAELYIDNRLKKDSAMYMSMNMGILSFLLSIQRLLVFIQLNIK